MWCPEVLKWDQFCSRTAKNNEIYDIRIFVSFCITSKKKTLHVHHNESHSDCSVGQQVSTFNSEIHYYQA